MKRKTGVTLIELLVSASILSLVGISAMGIMRQVTLQRSRNEAITQLTLLTHQKMQETLLKIENDEPLPEEGDFNFPDKDYLKGNIQYHEHPHLEGYQHILITLVWQADRFTEEYQLAGFIPGEKATW